MIRAGIRSGAALLLLTSLLASAAQAETRTIAATQLVLTDTMSEDVQIVTDPTLSGSIRLTMEDGLSCLSVVNGATAVIGTQGCGGSSGALRIDVSADTPVTLTSTGSGDIHVGDLRGPLIATLTGSGDLAAGRTGALVLVLRSNGDATAGEVDGPATIEISSSGDVKLKQVSGPLTVKQNSSGDLVVGGVAADAVTIDATGSGDMLIGAGHIERLRARLMGSGDLSVAATIGNADVEAHGSSDVKLATVTGTLNRAGQGSDIVVVGSSAADAIDQAVARKFGHGASAETSFSMPTPSAVTHLLTAGFVVLVLYICWRVVRRAGGLAGVGRRFGARTPDVPSNPAVLALCETMTRLDQRLGRLEMYVTTREFDLNRKFRELGS